VRRGVWRALHVWAELVAGLVQSALRCAVRQPSAVAANLALDALAAACKWARREREWISRSVPLDQHMEPQYPPFALCPLSEARGRAL
jgi:hypothetical protein